MATWFCLPTFYKTCLPGSCANSNDATEDAAYSYSHHYLTKTTMATEIDEDSELSSPSGGFLGRLFESCASDPRGSVHRGWGVSLIFVLLFFVIAVIESKLAGFGFLDESFQNYR